ncbi:MAG: hypothetical protein MUC60_11045 [Oscillatoria sp. Prado101]|jgi:ABC-type glycerol-3-phosphate transport system permease component|nr:hypothetical protein [Oscillatoria sp. Prado101]
MDCLPDSNMDNGLPAGCLRRKSQNASRTCQQAGQWGNLLPAFANSTSVALPVTSFQVATSALARRANGPV